MLRKSSCVNARAYRLPSSKSLAGFGGGGYLPWPGGVSTLAGGGGGYLPWSGRYLPWLGGGGGLPTLARVGYLP